MGNTALVGKTAFVTGASSGIGLASARILARDGEISHRGRGVPVLPGQPR